VCWANFGHEDFAFSFKTSASKIMLQSGQIL